jgi:hypothetical protein
MRKLPALTLAIMVMLSLGFARSGLATVRLYRDLFAAPAVSGPTATIDSYLIPLDLASGDQLRQAVKRANWEVNAEMSLVVDVSSLSPTQRSQVYLAASYLLYPARVSLRSSADVLATPSAGISRRIIVAGPSNPFSGAPTEEISGMLRLVSLP